MARERTKEEFLDQLVYAVASVAHHYGPAFSPEGLQEIRGLLTPIADCMFCDATWRVDVLEGGQDGNPDFCPSCINNLTTGLLFNEVIQASKTGEYADV